MPVPSRMVPDTAQPGVIWGSRGSCPWGSVAVDSQLSGLARRVLLMTEHILLNSVSWQYQKGVLM